MPRLRYDPNNDYYRLLGVAATASTDEIQQAFRRQAKELHPDRNPDRQAWATAAFQAVNEAYGVLSDPVRRRQYDDLRWPHASHAADARVYHGGTGDDDPRWKGPEAWSYAEWLRRHGRSYPPPPPRMVFAPRTPWAALVALLQGPFGSVYLFAALLFVMLVLSYAALNQVVVAVRPSAVPLSTQPPASPAAPTTVPPAAVPLTSCDNPAATIADPVDGARVPLLFSIRGSANPPNFWEYRLELAYLGRSESASREAQRTWTLLGAPAHQPVTDGVLVGPVSLLPLQPGYYALRLTVQLADGSLLPPCERIVFHFR